MKRLFPEEEIESSDGYYPLRINPKATNIPTFTQDESHSADAEQPTAYAISTGFDSFTDLGQTPTFEYLPGTDGATATLWLPENTDYTIAEHDEFESIHIPLSKLVIVYRVRPGGTGIGPEVCQAVCPECDCIGSEGPVEVQMVPSSLPPL